MAWGRDAAPGGPVSQPASVPPRGEFRWSFSDQPDSFPTTPTGRWAVMPSDRILFRRLPRVMPRIGRPGPGCRRCAARTRISSLALHHGQASAYRSSSRPASRSSTNVPIPARPAPRRPARRSRLHGWAGQELGQEDGPARLEQGLLEHALQLADVARPGVAPQRPPAPPGRRAACHRLAQLAAEAAEEVVDQQRQVVAALAQRRQLDGEDVEPVVQVAAERARRATSSSRSRLVAAITRTSAWIGLVAADPLELLLLQHAQQLRLGQRASCRRSRRGRACRRWPARTCRSAGGRRR